MGRTFEKCSAFHKLKKKKSFISVNQLCDGCSDIHASLSVDPAQLLGATALICDAVKVSVC